MLEGAAGFATLAGFYGYCCDTSRRHELRRLLIANALNKAIMLYTRFMHYWWSVFKVLSYFYASAAYLELAAGIVAGLGPMPMVAMAFIPEQWSKLLKFWRQYKEEGGELALQSAKANDSASHRPTLLQGSAAVHSHSAKEHME